MHKETEELQLKPASEGLIPSAQETPARWNPLLLQPAFGSELSKHGTEGASAGNISARFRGLFAVAPPLFCTRAAGQLVQIPACPAKKPELSLHVGFEAEQASHPLHVLVNRGTTRDFFRTLYGKPAPFAVPQAFPFVPTCKSKWTRSDKPLRSCVRHCVRAAGAAGTVTHRSHAYCRSE